MNTDGKMSYKDFVFPINPSVIRIESDRKISRTECAGGFEITADAGEKAIVISGEGEFFGRDCIKDFDRLNSKMGDAGILYLPSKKPILAFLESLEMICSDIEDVIGYKFRFIECSESRNHKNSQDIYGDDKKSLWDISYETGINIDILVQMNPHIRRPDIPVNGNERIKLCRK